GRMRRATTPPGATPRGATPRGRRRPGATPRGATLRGATPRGRRPRTALPPGATPRGATRPGAMPRWPTPSRPATDRRPTDDGSRHGLGTDSQPPGRRGAAAGAARSVPARRLGVLVRGRRAGRRRDPRGARRAQRRALGTLRASRGRGLGRAARLGADEQQPPHLPPRDRLRHRRRARPPAAGADPDVRAPAPAGVAEAALPLVR